jgi:hypothetical protein
MTLLRIYRLALVLMTVALVAVSLICVREHQRVQQNGLYVRMLRSQLMKTEQWRKDENQRADEWKSVADANAWEISALLRRGRHSSGYTGTGAIDPKYTVCKPTSSSPSFPEYLFPVVCDKAKSK